MAGTKDKRTKVQERRIVRSESRWLQKALFALGKASDSHEKLSELHGEEHEPLLVSIDDETFDIDTVTDALKDAVLKRSESLRAQAKKEFALAR